MEGFLKNSCYFQHTVNIACRKIDTIEELWLYTH